MSKEMRLNSVGCDEVMEVASDFNGVFCYVMTLTETLIFFSD